MLWVPHNRLRILFISEQIIWAESCRKDRVHQNQRNLHPIRLGLDCPVIQESRAPPRPQRLCRDRHAILLVFVAVFRAADGFRRAAVAGFLVLVAAGLIALAAFAPVFRAALGFS